MDVGPLHPFRRGAVLAILALRQNRQYGASFGPLLPFRHFLTARRLETKSVGGERRYLFIKPNKMSMLLCTRCWPSRTPPLNWELLRSVSVMGGQRETRPHRAARVKSTSVQGKLPRV